MKPFIPVSTGVHIPPEGKPGVQEPPHHHPHHSIPAQKDPSYSQWHHHDVAVSTSQMSQLAYWYSNDPVQGHGPSPSGPSVVGALPPRFPPVLPPRWIPPPPSHPTLPPAPPPRPQHFNHQPLDLPLQPPTQQPSRDDQRTQFYSTPAQTLYDSQTLPSPRTMAPRNLTPTPTNPGSQPSPSIQRGTDQIVALFAEETSRMRASFEKLISNMEEELIRERGEKENLWRRVQELEVELRSLRSSSMVQAGEGGR